MTAIKVFDVNFNKICRICLKENSVLHSISIQYNSSVKYVEMLEYLIGNAISDNPDGNLEVYICNECSAQLILSYDFKQQCLKSNEIIVKLCSEDYKEISEENSSDQIYFEDDRSIYKEDYDPGTSLPEYPSKNRTKVEDIDAISSNHDTDAILDNSQTKLIRKSKKNRNISEIRQCLKCNLEFSNFKSYSTHHRESHKPKVLCPLCGKLVAKHGLEKHLASIMHNTNKKHLCTECGKSFTLIENLEKHRRIHTGDKRYICEHCDMKFIHWNSKRSHIRSFHTGEKKYECNICGNRYAQSSNLFRHIRSHTGEMPHECGFCHKKFKTSPELKNHLVVHTKERNHVCIVCKKAFGTKKSLSAHNKIHTGERNYPCTVCTKAFTQAHVLRKHLQTHPNCPIPPAGAVLSRKALSKSKIFVKSMIVSQEGING